ncbi:MAG: RluA family pseudouridine synthase [Proteobacteria bacterium]|jgi:23S rRNA pseudouridine1911/1915/1917 synthase|nr:RluA family pseudouridine synthase [Pseudomonadota bacterium]
MIIQTPNLIETIVEEEEKGLRLDKFLSLKLEDISRSRLKNLICEGHILLINRQASLPNFKIDDPSHRVKPGESFSVNIPEIIEIEPLGEDIPLDIHYEDEHLLVLNKPAGLVVHPAPGNYTGTLVNALIAHCGDSLSGINGFKRPGIVHRIDKETSGLMVVAKSDIAHKSLSKQFADHSLERAYLALTWGMPNPASGTIDKPLGRDTKNRLKIAVRESGKRAVTHYKVVRRVEPKRIITTRDKVLHTLPPSVSLVECRLETGRTHQVRVHMAQIGYPLIGDQLYGRRNHPQKNFSENARNAVNNFRRQALHAYLIGFIHPVTKLPLTFETKLPNDIERLIKFLESV